ncbi:autotransporter outer membrane beta-barrel domain-containing protein [Fusobacterium varium]|uniref:autotransporter family protein n=1 Tax=Fusobacterium varium TaxID=856 RepID=UPI0032BF329D
MIEKIMKAVKRGNKRRGRNITIGAVIGFLLSCTVVMGADDNYLWIKEDSGAIKFSTNSTTGDNGDWKTENPYENAGNIWDKDTKTYTNNMTLLSSEKNGEYNDGQDNYDISYGLRLSGGLTDVNFINNSSITGEISGDGNGYGIHNSAEMGNIKNTGVISGTGNGAGSGAGTGYGIYNSSTSTMGKITNTGIISGIGSSSGSYGFGYGINNSGTMGKITNTGIISGIGSSSGSYGFGYGINNTGTIGEITNTGIISGYGTSSSNVSKGYGINNPSSEIKNITNTGVIYGKDSAIKNDSGTIGTVNNYGILATKGSSVYTDTINNYGMYITEADGKITVASTKSDYSEEIAVEYDENGEVIKSRSMTIKNAVLIGNSGSATSSESIELGSNNYDNYILNGKDETLKVTDTNNQVTGSIINAYGTAVVFGDTGDKELTLSGTIVNGGIDGSAAISGSDDTDNGDTLILHSGKIKYKDGSEVTQNTIVNGNIDMGAGADTLTIGDGTIINGILDGGDSDSEDTLNFGISSGAKSNSSESEGVRILHNISNFENMNINTNVTLFEKTINASGEVENLKVTGAEKITIEENGTLTLRIDSTNKDNLSGKIIGHALYENEGEISSTDGGKLLLALNGAGNQSIISFGDTKLNTSLVTEYEGEYYEDVTFGTTSLIHSVKRVNDTENEVEITVKKNLPLKTLKYEKLNKIYHGILSVEDLIANFNVDSNEKLSTFLGYLNDIYAGNPYSYSSELSRKSVGMFRDIAVESQFKPKLNKWLIMGGLTHVDGGIKDTYYGKGYYTYDIGSSDMDADTKITGAYMLGEYGVSDTLTYGVVIGGNKLKFNLSNGSKVDGDALYMGAYAKKYVGNLKVTGGLGLQYGDYDADRIAVNKVASSLAEPVMKYSDNYNDMTYDIYLNGRYSHNIGNNLFLEPYGTLSYTYVDQEGADEGSKVLAIETDSKTFDYTAVKVGIDLKKVILHEKGKSMLSAGVSYTRLLNGADEENITARFKGKDASDFDILVAHKNEHSIGLNAKYALELESGILFDVKGSYSVERDSHNGNGKNRTKGEWIVGAGLGYKF